MGAAVFIALRPAHFLLRPAFEPALSLNRRRSFFPSAHQIGYWRPTGVDDLIGKVVNVDVAVVYQDRTVPDCIAPGDFHEVS